MKTAYFDCFAGISGDMIIGALLDAGLDFTMLKKNLAALNLPGCEIRADKVMKNGIAATKFSVIAREPQPERHLRDIIVLLEGSGLGEKTKKHAVEIFTCLAAAEAKIHGSSIEKIHFHEIGAVDSIVDITGAVLAMDLLGLEKIVSSPVNTGTGMVQTGHGMLPVPAPATAELLKNVPAYSDGTEAELATPTGAAVITHFAERFGSLPLMKISTVGYGAGSRGLGIPNLLRVMIGETIAGAPDRETIAKIETNIDDMNPEFYGHVTEMLFGAGALDVYTVPVFMKKSRPGAILTVISGEHALGALADIIFSETTTSGIRISRDERITLPREIIGVSTRFGEVKVKVIRNGDALTIAPEYEDCRRIAREKKLPLKTVYDEAKNAAMEKCTHV